MGFIGSVFSNDKGAGFQGSGTSVTQPVSTPQVQQATGTAQGAVGQQQSFLNALMSYNGAQNQQQVFNQQQATSNQLQGIANGTGPNPAQSMLNQQTGQNVANQAALMAGQRGSSSNAGLIARQAAQQGAATEQQAVGQGATMQAQQSLGALSQLQQQQANMGSLAGAQIGQQQQAVSGLNTSAQGLSNQYLNQVANVNNNNVAMQGNINNVNAGIASGNQAVQTAVAGFPFGAGGSALQKYKGGPITKMAEGGEIPDEPISNTTDIPPAPGQQNGPQSQLGQTMHQTSTESPILKIVSLMAGAASQGGEIGSSKIPVMVSPGEVYIPPKKVPEVSKGKNPLQIGERIPGKAQVKGDSPKNDTVKRQLSVGGIVIPRSIVNSPDAAIKAARFVAAHKAHSRRMK